MIQDRAYLESAMCMFGLVPGPLPLALGQLTICQSIPVCLSACRAVNHLLEVLKPHSTENGGPLKVEHVSFVEGRGNLMITYTPEGASGKRCTPYSQLLSEVR